MGLNAAQQRAVEHSAGPLVVLAGPGTGKTRTITHRIEHLISGRGAEPESIVAVTFTVKAARQLRERLAELVGGPAADRVNVHTFHGLGLRILRRFGDLAGLPGSPDLMDSAQRRRLLRALTVELDLFRDSIAAGRDQAAETAAEVFRSLQDHAVGPEAAEKYAEEWGRRLRTSPPRDEQEARSQSEQHRRFVEAVSLYRAFLSRSFSIGCIAFNDLIALPERILSKNAGAAAIVRDEWRHFVVDEYQDSNKAQLAFLSALCPGQTPDVCVVGDDDQSIYGFRGADDRSFFHFKARWPGAEEIRLTDNYRSAEGIVRAANAMISRASLRFAPDKSVRSRRDDAGPGIVECVRLEHFSEDGPAIAAMILADRAREPSRAWGRYAVIARTSGDLDRVATALELEGVPVARSTPASAIDDEGVRDVMAWIRLLAHPEDAYSFLRILRRPPVGIDVETIAAWDRQYKAAQQAREAAGEPRQPFAGWVLADPSRHPALARLARLHKELTVAAGSLPADRAISRIITLTDAAHADLAGGSPESPGEAAIPRSRRITNLVTLLRFARTRQRRLLEPGNLEAWLSYYEDLDGDEQGLGEDYADRVEGGDAPEDEKPDAVQLLTAHKAKGLEFDTVFVTRVQPPHGFPKVKSEEGPAVPAELLDAGDTRDAKTKRMDEERRIFYVACTRAERRLVLVGTWKATPSKTSVNFAHELMQNDPEIAHHEGRDVVERAAEAGVRLRAWRGAGSELTDDKDRAAVLAQFRSSARRDAAAALDAVDRPGIGPAELERAEAALRNAAARIAAAAAIDAGADAPGWLAADKDLARPLDELKAAMRAAPTQAFAFRKQSPPLDLSFTSISLYLDCPRCWYVRHVLGLPETEDDALNIGSVVHRSLQRFYEELRAAEGEGHPLPTRARLEALCREEMKRWAGTSRVLDAEIQRRVIALALNAERMHDPSCNILELEKPFALKYNCGGIEHVIRGKIDRVEQLADGRIRVIDYKTGSATKKLLEPDEGDLQMGIYTMAVEQLFGAEGGNRAGGLAEYWVLSTGERGVLATVDQDLEKVRKAIDSAIAGMLEGKFPVGTQSKCRNACEVLGFSAEE